MGKSHSCAGNANRGFRHTPGVSATLVLECSADMKEKEAAAHSPFINVGLDMLLAYLPSYKISSIHVS